jgi:hypothetical protein
MKQSQNLPDAQCHGTGNGNRQQHGGTASAELQALAARLMDSHARLAEQQDFQQACREARRFTPIKGQPLYTRILEEEADMRLVLVGLHEAQPFPVHDHAGASACQVILEGSVRIRHYREVAMVNRAMVRMECIADSERNAGEFDSVDRQRAIHGLEAVSDRALILNCQQVTQGSLERYWYFPASMSRSDETLWYRIKREQH